ncbi:prepilin-type N-terminal cleavage/methylation domain-containing protein [Gemmatimonas sp.]|uniref:pilus assembly FimT family protein n=1 Tax=Gemmatimonas sp. TaxID=1962908 RepID=UPI00286DE28D|nr:prepilin-type N-terminal cleavage/methylation domain-containing protein [Gemmatimonas sp.]
MSRNTFPRAPRGFTIIELLAVVAIVSIMMAIILPKFRISEKTEVQLAGMQLAQDVDVARTRALSTREMVRVAFKTSTRTYGGYLDEDGNGTIAESDAEWQALRGFGVRELPARIQYSRGAAGAIPGDAGSGAVGFPDGRIEFDSRGLTMPMGTRGVVYLASQNDPYAVVAVQVTPSGNVRFWTHTQAGGWQ